MEEREGAGDHLRTGDKVLGTEREEDGGDDDDSKVDEGAIENMTRNVASRTGIQALGIVMVTNLVSAGVEDAEKTRSTGKAILRYMRVSQS